MIDVVIAGGGLAGLCLARQLKLEAPGPARARGREASPPGAARRRSRSASRASKSARTIFSKILGLEPHLRGAHLEKLGLRYFFPHRDNRESHTPRRAWAVRLSPGAVVPARSRPSRELRCCGQRAIPGSRCWTAPRCERSSAGDSQHDIEFDGGGGRDARRAQPLARRRERPRRTDQASARPRPDGRRIARTRAGSASRSSVAGRRLVRRSGVAVARAVRPALAEHQSPDGAPATGCG